MRCSAPGPLRESLEEIYIASLQARDVVRQLPTFSHQDEVPCKTLNLADVVREVPRLISTTPPENASMSGSTCLTWMHWILGNSSQIYQLILNFKKKKAMGEPTARAF